MVNVRSITLNDVTGIKLLADGHRLELGFNARQKFEEVALQQRGFVALMDDVLVGFVIFRHRKIDQQTTLSDICVAQPQRNQQIGSCLICALINQCTLLSRDYIQLKCPVALPANDFYQRLGFTLDRTEVGKKRPLNVWRFPITPPPTHEG
jgi:ribosomal protein S18 acetylase RimI-like enzyme